MMLILIMIVIFSIGIIGCNDKLTAPDNDNGQPPGESETESVKELNE